MIDVKRFCKVPLELKRALEPDHTGAMAYEDPVTIMTWPSVKIKQIRTQDGQEVTSNMLVISPEEMNIDDVLVVDGVERVILEGGPARDARGRINHYEARL